MRDMMHDGEAQVDVVRYVEFLVPGSLYPNQVTQPASEVLKDDGDVDPSKVPASAYAYMFFDRVEGVARVNGEDHKIFSMSFNRSHRCFINGTVYTVKQIREEFGDDGTKDILLRNVESNGWDRVVLCRTGNWQPMLECDENVQIDTQK